MEAIEISDLVNRIKAVVSKRFEDCKVFTHEKPDFIDEPFLIAVQWKNNNNIFDWPLITRNLIIWYLSDNFEKHFNEAFEYELKKN